MFGELVAAYLFLGGTGGGACAVAGVLGMLADRDDVRRGLRARFRDERGRVYARFFGFALAAALGALLVGAVCLLADMGRVDRVLLLMTSWPLNYLVVGAWSLLVCGTLAAAALLVWCGMVPARLGVLRALHGALAVTAVVTVLYTGLLLSDMPSVPLWNTPWLVAVFALSGLSCGLALVLLSALGGGTLELFASVSRRLARADVLVIALEAAAVAFWLGAVWLAAGASGDAPTPTDVAALGSVWSLLAGPWAPWLWLGLGLVGLVLPLGAEALAARGGPARGVSRGGSPSAPGALADPVRVPAPPLVLTAALCVLAGGAILRYLVVAAGALPVVVSPM